MLLSLMLSSSTRAVGAHVGIIHARCSGSSASNVVALGAQWQASQNVLFKMRGITTGAVSAAAAWRYVIRTSTSTAVFSFVAHYTSDVA
jgi:hypothetical protein